MSYLSVENVTKTYGDKVLFENIGFHIDKGEKVALIAKNGSGKSTLLRVLTGEESPEGEQGIVRFHKDAVVGLLRQEPRLDPRHTVEQAVFATDNAELQAVKAYERALKNPDDGEALQKALVRMDELKAWDAESRVKGLLSRFDITDLDQRIGTLSGGQKKRVALTRILMEDPDFLILDEPTNHLDVEMIEWLEEYLQAPNLTLFVVTHDRYFLDSVCNTILELNDGQIHRYRGNYSYFLEKRAEQDEIDQRTLERNKKLLKGELEWMRRQPKARGTKAKARVTSFYDLKDATSKPLANEELEMDFKTARLGKKIIEAHNISKAFGDFKIIEGFTYKFKKRERVGLVGPNGVGKTTFLQMLTGGLKPDTGKVVIGDTIVFGYYTQSGMRLPEDRTVLDALRDIAEYIELNKGRKLYAHQMLERFMFPPKQQRVYVSQLSGGEKRRLYLLTVLMQNPNFLILDEPTNDLDLITLNVLEEYLMEYTGCLMVVSHDRYFMDKLVDHIFVLEGGGQWRDYNGNYTDYRQEKLEATREAQRLEREAEKAKQQAQAAAAPKGNDNKLTYAQRKQLAKLEREIDKLEAKKAEISAAFNDTSLTSERITELSVEIAQVTEQIEEKEMAWMELAEG